MKRYRLSFAASLTHAPSDPARTAWKPGTGMDFDKHYRVWPSRASMARSIRMQQRGAPRADHWKACMPLTDGEGY